MFGFLEYCLLLGGGVLPPFGLVLGRGKSFLVYLTEGVLPPVWSIRRRGGFDLRCDLVRGGGFGLPCGVVRGGGFASRVV